MTVIAWDGVTLAADKRAVTNMLARTVTKIKRKDHLLFGASGDTASCLEAMAWVERGRDADDFPEAQKKAETCATLLVIDSGKILVYETSPIPIVYEDRIYATGSGRDYALAAMFLGKTALEAVEVACEFDTGCGNGIDVLRAYT